MDAKNALEAVEAIRSTVPETGLPEFDASLVELFGLVVKGVGPVAIEAATSDEAELTTEAKLDPSDVREVLFGKLDVAHRGHTAVVEALNTGRRKDKFEAADRDTIETEFTAWLSEEKLCYITEQLAAGRVAHVTASPNVEIDVKTYEKAARKFGENQRYSTDFYSDVASQCTPAELSGTDPENGNKVHFNVVFEDFDDELYGTVQEQKDGLTKLKQDAPFLEAPSRIKSLTYDFTLREDRDGNLSGSGVNNLTYMRDYMVEPRRVGHRLYVPFSFVRDYGGPVVSSSHVQNPVVGRALVG